MHKPLRVAGAALPRTETSVLGWVCIEIFIHTNMDAAKAHGVTYNCGQLEQKANPSPAPSPGALEEFVLKADKLKLAESSFRSYEMRFGAFLSL